jgi:hypothetical protein
VANYFIGNDPSKWQANVPTYGSVLYRDLYPGIDLRYSPSLDVPRNPLIPRRSPSEKIPVRTIRPGRCPYPLEQPLFGKRGSFWTISGMVIISFCQKSGEFGKNGTMRRFPGPVRALIGLFPSWKKIRANTRNWEANVPIWPAIAQDQQGGAVLGPPVIGVFGDPVNR